MRIVRFRAAIPTRGDECEQCDPTVIVTSPAGGSSDGQRAPLDQIADDSSLSIELASIDGDQNSETDSDVSS